MSALKLKIGPKQEAAVLALLSSKNVEEAARVAGVTPRTLYRWLKEPEFEAAYRAARRQAYGQSISRLQQGSTAAATTLLKVMIDVATPPSTRVRAAEAVLSHAETGVESPSMARTPSLPSVWLVEVSAKLGDRVQVEANRGGRIVADLEVLQHPLSKWGHCETPFACDHITKRRSPETQ